MEMNYLQEAENGKRICIDELRISDVAEFIQDINSDPDGVQGRQFSFRK